MVRIIDEARQIVERGTEVFFDPVNHVEFRAARMVVLDRPARWLTLAPKRVVPVPPIAYSPTTSPQGERRSLRRTTG